MRIYKIVGIVLSAILLLASCTNSDLEKKKVKIAYANWLEGIAMRLNCKMLTLPPSLYLCQERNLMSFWMPGYQ